jgi:hypothetical protein
LDALLSPNGEAQPRHFQRSDANRGENLSSRSNNPYTWLNLAKLYPNDRRSPPLAKAKPFSFVSAANGVFKSLFDKCENDVRILVIDLSSGGASFPHHLVPEGNTTKAAKRGLRHRWCALREILAGDRRLVWMRLAIAFVEVADEEGKELPGGAETGLATIEGSSF